METVWFVRLLLVVAAMGCIASHKRPKKEPEKCPRL